MISIKNEVIKKQNNFWSQCLFHPTDAVEDPWGRRILDKIAADHAINTVRIYTMFEDIVYIGEDGKLCYDFRLSDLRLDYLVECGFNLLLAYGGMPDCIAETTDYKTVVAKEKTRYKGKKWNASPAKDWALWEEICYEYTKHILERYGLETVSKWRLQCFNEPDIPHFFLPQYPETAEDSIKYRIPAYCKMYESFEKGIRRASEKVKLGGPALAHTNEFLGAFLDYVKENDLKLDFISVHNYGTYPEFLNDGTRPISVKNNMNVHKGMVDTVKAHGFGDVPLLLDEWGMSACGWMNRELCPTLMVRETEVFSAYFAKLIHEFVYSEYKMDMLCICLSGQHEMEEDFTGFRNFFTLNFITKPIYNTYILANRLGEDLLASDYGENLFVVPTKNEKGNYSVMISYSSENFEENIPEIKEEITFDEDISGKTVRVWCIDKNTTNPYRTWINMGMPEIKDDVVTALRREGTLTPIREFTSEGSSLSLSFTPNSTYLITVD